MISTDLHGNGEDYRKLREQFLALHQNEPRTHWVILGDLVHAPNAASRREQPHLYDFKDESWPIVSDVARLRLRFRDNVHLVLGNHDHGHIGGPRTSKFYPDEVAHLESALDQKQIAVLREQFRSALLVVVAGCGVVMAHGSPNDRLASVEGLGSLVLEGPNDDEGAALLDSLLRSYGQPAAVTARMLRALSADTAIPLGVVVHGHDRAEEGWFAEGGNQICPVLFGAPRDQKRYLLLDLGARYTHASTIRDEIEIRRLYG